jgi:hypothetical protein
MPPRGLSEAVAGWVRCGPRNRSPTNAMPASTRAHVDGSGIGCERNTPESETHVTPDGTSILVNAAATPAEKDVRFAPLSKVKVGLAPPLRMTAPVMNARSVVGAESTVFGGNSTKGRMKNWFTPVASLVSTLG